MAAHLANHPPGYLPPGYASPEKQSLVDYSRFTNLSTRSKIILAVVFVIFASTNLAFFRLASILSRPQPEKRKKGDSPAHLMVVLGSGGHTAEMLNILANVNIRDFNRRTYVISSGDGFSAQKAKDFESEHGSLDYEIVTVRRARRVHQSMFTAPLFSLLCLYDSLSILSTTPDLILTNGPGTGVCVVFAAILRLFFGADRSKMRSVYIESWARVKSLSLSGRILKPFVDRFIVQWPELVEVEGKRVEYAGHIIS